MISRSEYTNPAETVLVIGGRGFVGSHVVRALLQAGLNSHLFGPAMSDDLLSDVAGRFGETNGSVEDLSSIRDAIRKSGARSIVTTAAHSVGRQGLMRSGDAEADRALAINVLGFRNVLEAAREENARRVVWTGSTVVYGPADRYGAARVTEDAPTGPITFYGLTKLMSEDMAHYYRDRYGCDVVGLRLPLVLGRGLWYQGAASAIAGIAAEAVPGKTHAVSFHNDQLDLMHVGDATRAIVAALLARSKPAATYNINGFTARLSDFIEATEKAVPGYTVEHAIIPSPLRFPLIDDARFRAELGFTPAFDITDVVADMLAPQEALS